MEIKLTWLDNGQIQREISPDTTFPVAFGMLTTLLEELKVTHAQQIALAQQQALQNKEGEPSVDSSKLSVVKNKKQYKGR